MAYVKHWKFIVCLWDNRMLLQLSNCEVLFRLLMDILVYLFTISTYFILLYFQALLLHPVSLLPAEMTSASVDRQKMLDKLPIMCKLLILQLREGRKHSDGDGCRSKARKYFNVSATSRACVNGLPMVQIHIARHPGGYYFEKWRTFWSGWGTCVMKFWLSSGSSLLWLIWLFVKYRQECGRYEVKLG